MAARSATFSTSTVSPAADTTSPTLIRATILANGQLIELQLSENVQRSNLPLAAAFTATAGGSPVTISLVLVPAALDTYWISVSSIIRQGQDVAVAYTDPTGGDDVKAIQDVAGNDAATFTTGTNGVPSVTNNSTVNTFATGAPTISGTPQVGQTLTASTTTIMDDNGLTGVSYTYQWIRVDGGDSDISGATSSTYILVDDDQGKTIKVKVSFTDDASNSETLTSAAYPTNGTVQRITVSFGATTYMAPEGGSVNVAVNLNVDPMRTVGIPIRATVQGTTTTADYSVPTSVTFTAGQMAKTITFTANQDTDDDDDDSVLLTFGTLPTGVSPGTTAATTVSIIDDDVPQANRPPTAADGTVTQREDSEYTFKTSDFSYADADRNAFASVKITGLTDKGALTLNNAPITSTNMPKAIDATRIRLTKLTYDPPDGANGTPYTSFKFRVNDGTADSVDEYTMTINITQVNDPAYGRPYIRGGTQVGYALFAITHRAIGDRDGVPDVFDYQWKRYAADGTTFEANIGTNSSSYRLTPSDLGKKIRVEVSFTDNEGNREGPLASVNTPWLPTQTVGEATFQSIMGVGGDTVYAFTADHGQVFTTGTNPTGYTVSRVILTSEDPDGDDIAVQICEVDESGNPTAVCTTLAGPGVFPKGLLSFTAPNGTTLAGGRTKYMVVIKSPGGDSVRVDATRSDGFDSSARDSGWSIGWRTRIKTTDGWQDVARTRIRIAILGTINP